MFRQAARETEREHLDLKMEITSSRAVTKINNHVALVIPTSINGGLRSIMACTYPVLACQLQGFDTSFHSELRAHA